MVIGISLSLGKFVGFVAVTIAKPSSGEDNSRRFACSDGKTILLCQR
jgi:hypothetical protein